MSPLLLRDGSWLSTGLSYVPSVMPYFSGTPNLDFYRKIMAMPSAAVPTYGSSNESFMGIGIPDWYER